MKSANVSITILSDGDRTVTEAAYHSYMFPSVAATASSGREPGDKSDERIGEALAVARVLHSIAARLEKRAAGTMKHKESIAEHRLEIAARAAEAESHACCSWHKEEDA